MTDSKSFLQRFFDASLIPSDTTDERLGHYESAAVELKERFKKAPQDAVAASLVAFDPRCPASDPWFGMVEETVKIRWKTFLANHHDAPRQICRAILLDAISKAVADDDYLSAAIWNAASVLLPYFGDGREQDITREFASQLGERCEAYSSSIWDLDASGDDPQGEIDVKLKLPKIVGLNAAELQKGLSDAAGPNDAQGQSHGDPNPHWPNQSQPWAHNFAPRAAKAIAGEVNKGMTEIASALTETGKQIEAAVKRHGRALMEWVTESERRKGSLTRLLWWKQALYSPILRSSYRTSPSALLALAMPLDLCEVSGAPIPQSVEFFLRETVKAVVPDDTPFTLSDFVAAIKSNAMAEAFLPAAPDATPRRMLLSEFLRVVRTVDISEDQIPTYVGVGGNISLPLSNWTVWILRNRQAHILAQSGSEA